MAVMATAGLTPFEILQSGTRNVAVYFNTLKETGTVEQASAPTSSYSMRIRCKT
jgi:imidazolonepropionase-like amidohydrolase